MNAFSNIDFGVLVPGESIITATGTTQATAYPLRRQVTVFSTVPLGSGAILPSSYAAGTPPIAMNRGANDLLVYPATGDQIENLGVNAPYTVAAGDDATFISFDPPLARSPRQWWLITSPLGLNTNPIFDSITGGADPFNINGRPASVTFPNGGGIGILGATSALGSGGAINIIGGNSGASSLGAGVTVNTGVGGLGSGALLLRTANANGATSAGALTIRTGRSGSGATGSGGNLGLIAGDALSTDGNGGNISATAGNGTGSGAAGGFTLAAGTTAAGLRGPIFLNGLSNTLQLQLSGTIATTGAFAAGNAWLFLNQALSGSNASGSGVTPIYFKISNNLVTSNSSGSAGMRVQVDPGGQNSGFQTAFIAAINAAIANSPGDGAVELVAVEGFVQSSVNEGGRVGNTSGTDGGIGHLTSLYGQTFLSAGGKGFATIFGAEINASAATGASYNIRSAIKAGTTAISQVRGLIDDTAINVSQGTISASRVGFKTAYAVGQSTAGWPLDNDSTIFDLLPRFYPTFDQAIFFRGIDLTWAMSNGITGTGFAFGSPYFMVGPAGQTFVNGLVTTGSVKSQTASVASISIDDAGSYTFFPDIFIDTTPGGIGTPATASVSHMKGVGINNFGNTGKNHTAGIALSATGGTGTPPTFIPSFAGNFTATIAGLLMTVTVPPASGVLQPGQLISGAGVTVGTYITSNGTGTGGVGTYQITPTQVVAAPTTMTAAGLDASGRILALALLTAGAWSQAPSGNAPIKLTPASGVGTGAWINIIQYSKVGTNPITFTPLTWEFAASGEGYVVNDILSVADNTGTTPTYRVNTVTSDVGALTYDLTTASTLTYSPALGVQTAGDITVKGTGQYHLLTGGSGTGAYAQPLYGILTIAVAGGSSGYQVNPPPKTYALIGERFIASKLTAVMTPAAAILDLTNGSQPVTITAPAITDSSTKAVSSAWVAGQGTQVLLGSATINLNTAGDQTITLDLRGYAHWRPTGGTTAVGSTLLFAASTTATTAVGGIYTAAAKGGTALVPNTQTWSVAATTGVVLAAWQATPAATLQTATTLYFNLTTLEGTSRTAILSIYGILLP